MEESQQLRFPSQHDHSGYGNNNKLVRDHSLQNISGHDGSSHLADSGYNSYHSFNASSSVARSVLATIDEDNEADCSYEGIRCSETPLKISTILTPTTAASIEQISNFHLTTPNSVTRDVLGKRKVLARKPTIQNLYVQRTPEKCAGNADFMLASIETPLRSGRKPILGSLTPRKNKTSAKRKLTNFREKLHSDGDLRTSPEKDDSLEGDCKRLDQEDISPIYHAKRRRNSVIDDLIRSSTPKTASFKSNFHVETRENINWDAIGQGQPNQRQKPLILRKFQSFSPSKMYSYGKRDSILQDKPITSNRRAPLQRQNALKGISPVQELQKLGKPLRTSSEESSMEQSIDITDGFSLTPVKGKNISALFDAPIIVPQSTTEEDFRETDLEHQVSQIASFDDCSFTPVKACLSKTDILPQEDCVLREAVAPSILERTLPSIIEDESPFIVSLNIPRTPTSASKSRKLKRLNSRTQLSSTKKEKPRSKAPSPKLLRSQPTIPGTYRRSYVGIERLNILKRLNEQDKDALEIVLDYLADADLVRVVAVSRGWRSIIKTHQRTNRRLREYLALEAHIKENVDRIGSAAASLCSSSSRDASMLGSGGGALVGKSLNCDTIKESSGGTHATVVRQPFSLYNSINNDSSSAIGAIGSVQKSPPVSPSKRKFRENQKIASHLKKSERLKACPRCAKPSRVVLSKSTIKLALAAGALDPRSMAKLDRSYTLPSSGSASIITVASPVSPNNADRIRRNLFSINTTVPRSCSVDARSPPTTKVSKFRRAASDTSACSSLLGRKITKNGSMLEQQQAANDQASQCDYAVCSGKSCGFIFCIKCLCEYHPGTVCKELSPNSPSKEEHTAHNIACSKQSRRSLLRLRK
ncbi:uncharacterized protein LOC129768692 [Toxorhynchites rutilus septentrionalis]|uniref:uncharacterized protein LOC129768692 n=1 Tax=Toxorhynchites rutilus septentrionalis TaxID=329112 RepID=UPI00247977F0|nr:uncharacterized protein LOC129768692 [Toxorhynchites rutilus septentrionalis]XP_055626460.1 uncharacterized protein LOC129768692 [Toxorhynchites rutilus septentrionalis]XP_055626461.1 uncharacterized protein LOC129768692 [Toxorhynchites rutilus septentrionalis]